jgi:hypothetical protein
MNNKSIFSIKSSTPVGINLSKMKIIAKAVVSGN